MSVQRTAFSDQRITVKTFRDLKVWQKAHLLVLEIYRSTKIFPPEEKFGLVTQMRRAGVSIATNIVEGHKRPSKNDFVHFLNISQGSVEEVKYLSLLSHDLGFLNKEIYSKLQEKCDEVGRMLYAFKNNLSAVR